MQSIEEKKHRIHRLVDGLSPEQLEVAEAVLEQLRHEARVSVKSGKRIVRLGGLWQDLDIEINEEDITRLSD
jgi:hypothetical protein